MAIRFVPFATVTGKPKNISKGKLKTEPLPAKTLIKPTIKPTATSAAACQYSIYEVESRELKEISDNLSLISFNLLFGILLKQNGFYIILIIFHRIFDNRVRFLNAVGVRNFAIAFTAGHVFVGQEIML